MSGRLATDAAPAEDWKELASRENDGLAIGLLWSRTSGRVKVDVIDDRLDESFGFYVDLPDALSAFYHPFAYAPEDDVTLGERARDSLDLQSQN